MLADTMWLKTRLIRRKEFSSGDISYSCVRVPAKVVTHGGVMAREPIPEDVRRFILTSIASVPYLEALLLLRNASDQSWDSARVAQRLYISEKAATELLSELYAAGFVAATELETSYRYHPNSAELRQMIDQLAEIYAKNLVEVTNLIHSKIGKRAQQFADAFKWRKDT
ncbi:MAG TPA: hypothetical protein VLK82_19305 [Candidatus Tectomicrobia bacterium]|nr:hypothetical protein [Candidatus Tectomicrobia bacterium]